MQDALSRLDAINAEVTVRRETFRNYGKKDEKWSCVIQAGTDGANLTVVKYGLTATDAVEAAAAAFFKVQAGGMPLAALSAPVEAKVHEDMPF